MFKWSESLDLFTFTLHHRTMYLKRCLRVSHEFWEGFFQVSPVDTWREMYFIQWFTSFTAKTMNSTIQKTQPSSAWIRTSYRALKCAEQKLVSFHYHVLPRYPGNLRAAIFLLKSNFIDVIKWSFHQLPPPRTVVPFKCYSTECIKYKHLFPGI